MALLTSSSTLLLSAGPRAGKSQTMLALRREFAGPVLTLDLTPEDTNPEFLFYRLLERVPALRAHVQELRGRFPHLSSGAILGHAIPSSFLAVAVDDFHLIEGTPAQQEMEAFFRQLPPETCLIVSSRNQLSDFGRSNVERWDADDPRWREQPTLADLRELPEALRRRVLSLYLVGEAEFSSADEALISRNIARHGPGNRLELRAAWQASAECLIRELAFDEGLWREVERELAAFQKRHLRTERDSDFLISLERIPSEVRRSRPFLLRLEGQQLFDGGRFSEARGYFETALACARDDSERVAARLCLLATVARLNDQPAMQVQMAELKQANLQLGQEMQLSHEQALALWGDNRPDEASTLLERLLGAPIAGDRALAYQHFQAVQALWAINLAENRNLCATRHASAMLRIASEHRLSRDTLSAQLSPLLCQLRDRSTPLPAQALLQVSDDALRAATPCDVSRYLEVFGRRACTYGEPDIALRFLKTALRHARSHSLDGQAESIKLWQMKAAASLGDLTRCRTLLNDFESHGGNLALNAEARFIWAKCLAEAGKLDEALKELAACGNQAMGNRERQQIQLFGLWVRHRKGDGAALQEAKQLLSLHESAELHLTEVEVIARMELSDLRPRYRLRGFGEVALRGRADATVQWTRRKPKALLAILMACPEGVSSAELIAVLFKDTDSYDPPGMLNTLVYHLRQVIKTLRMEELIDTSRDRYRLRGDLVDFCDIWEFTGLYQKGRTLEAMGQIELSRLLFELAFAVMGGGLFLDVSDDLGPAVSPLLSAVANIDAMAKEFGW